MLFITPLLLILTLIIVWAFIKSITRFKTEYVWYKNFRRPQTNRVCRAIISRRCVNQCPNVPIQLQVPIEQQFYYGGAHNNNPSMPQFRPQVPVMEMAIPYNYAQTYYPPGMHYYLEPPPIYPGIVSNLNDTIRPTAPPFDETKG